MINGNRAEKFYRLDDDFSRTFSICSKNSLIYFLWLDKKFNEKYLNIFKLIRNFENFLWCLKN